MTNEERLKWLEQIESDICVCSLDSTFADDAKSCAIRSAIDELEQHRWIPVTERLPEKEGDYLVTKVDDENVTIIGLAYYGHGFGLMFYNNDWASNKTITAWMPLPKPYEEGAEE